MKKCFFPLMAGLLLFTLVLSVGVAFARYQVSYQVPINLGNAYTADETYLLRNYMSYWDFDENVASADTWIYDEAENTYYLNFFLSNGDGLDTYAEQDQNVTLQVAATVEDYSTEKENSTVVRLMVGSEEYVGVAEPIIKGTVFWRQHGEGRIYRFYNEAGEEITWTLIGGQLFEIPMMLAVSDGTPNTVFTLMTDRKMNS